MIYLTTYVRSALKMVLLSLLALQLGTGSAFAQKSKKKDKKAEKETAATDSTNAAPQGKKALQEKLKTCVADSGLFVLFRDTTTGVLWIRLDTAQLEQEYIHFVYSENGVRAAGHFRGNYRGSSIIRFRRYFNRIEVVKENVQHYFDPNSPLSKAADANISPAILASLKIVAEDSTAGHLLLSGDELFMSEALHQVKPSYVPNALAAFGFQLGSLNKEKSRIHHMRNYPENTDLVIDYTYDNPYPVNRGGSDVTDARAITLRLQHSLISVPDNSFEVRLEDPRVGYFTQKVNDMTTTRSANWRDPISRWHLEKKDPTAEVSEPVQPIVWWLENTTPVEFREPIRQGILAWNEAFEAAGFRNAVEVKIQPDDADWDAGDIRYNVVRWTSSPAPLFGGYGPSFVNPRTGQILGAGVMLEWAFITNRVQLEQLLTDKTLGWEQVIEQYQASLTETAAHSCTAQPDYSGHSGHEDHHCGLGMALQQGLQFGLAHLATQSASTIQVTELMEQALYYLAMHEVGHTLGLSHNMRASQLHTPAQLQDRERVVSQGLIASVMDYPAIHVDPDTSKQTLYYTTKPGPYDIWAIQYGYTPALNNPTEESDRMRTLLNRSNAAELAFGNDADDMRSPGKAIDPRVMIGDMSGDAVAYAKGRIGLANRLLTELPQKYQETNESYHELRINFGRTLKEIEIQAGVVCRYIGGVYVERDFQAQPGARVPYTPVPAAQQQAAMQLLTQDYFAPTAFRFSPDLLTHLQPQRRGFDFFGKSEDPKVTDMVKTLHSSVLIHILHPATLRRVINSSEYGNAYPLPTLFTDLTNGIFQADFSGSVNIYRQNLQALYVYYLLRIANLENPLTGVHPYAARTEAANQLRRLRTQLARAAQLGDAPTQSHRAFLLHAIDQAFALKK